MKKTLLLSILLLAVGCNALVKDESSAREGGEETPPDGPTLPVDVAGSYLVGVAPAGAEAPAGFGTPAEEVFGAGLFKRHGLGLAETGLVKATGTLTRVVVELELTDGRKLRPATIAAPPLSRWHVFFRVEASVMAAVVRIAMSAEIDGVLVAPPPTSDFAFVPPAPTETPAVVSVDETGVDKAGGQTPAPAPAPAPAPEPAPAPAAGGGNGPTVSSLTLTAVVADGYLNASEALTSGALLTSHPEGATRYAYVAPGADCIAAMPTDTAQPNKGAFAGADGEYKICAHQPLSGGATAYWASPAFKVDRVAPTVPMNVLIRGDSPTTGPHAASDDDMQIFPAWSAEDGTYGLLEIYTTDCTGAPTNVTTPAPAKSYAFTAPLQDVYLFKVKARDAAGNVSDPSVCSAATDIQIPSQGDLDTSFGGTGLVSLVYGQDSRPRAAAVDSQGRIVIVGEARIGSADLRATINRLLPNGDADVDFTSKQASTSDCPMGYNSTWETVAIGSDDKVIVGGWCSDGAGTDAGSWALVGRYTALGSIDATFGIKKVDVSAGAPYNEQIFALTVDAGDVYFAGRITHTGHGDDWLVGAFASDGTAKFPLRSLDFANGMSTFGQVARAIVKIDTKLYIGGLDDGSSPGLAVLNASDGSYDTTYNGSGRRNFSFETDLVPRVTGLLVDGGKLVINGRSQTQVIGVRRVTPATDVLDSTFNASGYETHTHPAYDTEFGHRLIRSGSAYYIPFAATSTNGLAVVKMDDNGTVTSFGSSGIVNFSSAPKVHKTACLASGADGKIVIVGYDPDPDLGTDWHWLARRIAP